MRNLVGFPTDDAFGAAGGSGRVAGTVGEHVGDHAAEHVAEQVAEPDPAATFEDGADDAHRPRGPLRGSLFVPAERSEMRDDVAPMPASMPASMPPLAGAGGPPADDADPRGRVGFAPATPPDRAAAIAGRYGPVALMADWLESAADDYLDKRVRDRAEARRLTRRLSAEIRRIGEQIAASERAWTTRDVTEAIILRTIVILFLNTTARARPGDPFSAECFDDAAAEELLHGVTSEFLRTVRAMVPQIAACIGAERVRALDPAADTARELAALVPCALLQTLHAEPARDATTVPADRRDGYHVA